MKMSTTELHRYAELGAREQLRRILAAFPDLRLVATDDGWNRRKVGSGSWTQTPRGRRFMRTIALKKAAMDREKKTGKRGIAAE